MKKNLEQLFNEEFLPECRYSSKLSNETIRGYESSFRLFEILMPEIIYPIDLSTRIMTDFFKKLEERERVIGKGTIKKGIKKSTVATYWSKLNKFFRWLKRREYIDANPFEAMDFPCVNYDDRKYLKKEDIDRIFAAISFNIKWSNIFVQKRNILIFALTLVCGLRKSEILGLTVNDIDLERKQLTVRAETSKSKSNRIIPLNQFIIPKIKDYLNERRRKEYMSEYLFVSDSFDRKFTKHGLKHLIAKVVKSSGVKFHIHLFRHTFAVNLIGNGSDIAKLKQLMGHRDIRMTASYLRCLPSKVMRNDVEVLNLENLI